MLKYLKLYASPLQQVQADQDTPDFMQISNYPCNCIYIFNKSHEQCTPRQHAYVGPTLGQRCSLCWANVGFQCWANVVSAKCPNVGPTSEYLQNYVGPTLAHCYNNGWHNVGTMLAKVFIHGSFLY